MFSTVGDLHRWHRALTEGELLSPGTVTIMGTPVAEGYGYGLEIGEIGGHRSVGHSGRSAGLSRSSCDSPTPGSN